MLNLIGIQNGSTPLAGSCQKVQKERLVGAVTAIYKKG